MTLTLTLTLPQVALTAAPVLCHDLSRSLPAKLDSLASLGDPAHLLLRAPTLLLLDKARLGTRREELRALLGAPTRPEPRAM